MFWLSGWKKIRKLPAESLFRTQPKKSRGIVEAVGPGMVSPEGKVIPMTVKVGDKVLFGKWSGSEVKINGEERLLIKEPEILGIIEE